MPGQLGEFSAAAGKLCWYFKDKSLFPEYPDAKNFLNQKIPVFDW